MAQPASTTINLKIKCLKSEDFELSIDSEASVDELKEEIVRLRSIESTKQRLIYKGRVLKSDKKLKDYKISDKTTIHLIIRKQSVTNPRNDEPTPQNSTNTNNRNTNTIPTGTTAISVAVVDGTNGAADVNSILSSVLSGFSSGNLNQASLQNQIQSAINSNPAHVMNLRSLLNPGDNPNAPNDDDISSIDGDDDDTAQTNTRPNTDNNSRNRFPELQPQFAVSNGRGGYSPVMVLPPVLRSCNAINLELDRLQKNYNRDVMGIQTEEEKKDSNVSETNANANTNVSDTANQSQMSIDANANANTTADQSQMNIDDSNIEVEVQTIVADSTGNVISNNVQNMGTEQTAQTDNTQSQLPQPPQRRRREYLNNLLDTWERYNEIVNGVNAMEDSRICDTMSQDNGEDNDNDNDMAGFKGVMDFIEDAFEDLVDFQNTVESGLNTDTVSDEQKESKDEDNDMEMKGNETEELKGYSKERKDALKGRMKSAGNMLVEIGTVLASMGHMMEKMDIHRRTNRNRLRITGLSGVSHVVRTAVPVEISTIVSHGVNMQNIGQQMQQMRRFQQMAQGTNNANANTNAQSQNNAQSSNANAQTQSNAPAPAQPNTNTNTNAQASVNNNAGNSSNLLSSLLDSFAGNNANNASESKTDASMEVDNEQSQTSSNVQNASNTNTNTNTNNANPMSALMNAFTGGNSGNNPLASLMNAFGGNRNRNNASNTGNASNSNDRNPLMLINRTLKFLIDTLHMSEMKEIRNANYTFIRNYRNGLKSFIANSILSGNDTPMRRHEMAMDYANGFGLFMISQFGSERRDVIRSLTVNHFRNNTPLLCDIILDSNSEIVFEERIIKWIKSTFSAFIYKLSLKYTNRLEGVKKLFGTILMNAVKYLYRNNNQILTNLQFIPSFVSYFVDCGKAYHLQQMARQHSSQSDNGGNAVNNGANNNTVRSNNKSKVYGNEQWVMNVEESERNRWLDTIRCDQKRMKQCLQNMKGHKWSESYTPSVDKGKSNEEQKNDKK